MTLDAAGRLLASVSRNPPLKTWKMLLLFVTELACQKKRHRHTFGQKFEFLFLCEFWLKIMVWSRNKNSTDQNHCSNVSFMCTTLFVQVFKVFKEGPKLQQNYFLTMVLIEFIFSPYGTNSIVMSFASL